MNKFFIIDAMNLAHRSYYVFKDLKTSSGQFTGATYGASSFMFNLINSQKPDFIAVATDLPTKTFRHEMSPDYKNNRAKKDDSFIDQLPLFYELFEKMKIPVLRQEGFEADDIIGTLAKRFSSEMEVYIVSSDKDFMQCLDNNVFMYKPLKWPNFEIISNRDVPTKLGVSHNLVVDYMSIVGDTSDNIKGVKGIGPKGAQTLIAKYGSLDGIYANISNVDGKNKEKLELNKSEAYLARELVKIRDNIDLTLDMDSAKLSHDALNSEELKSFYERLEFESFKDAVANQANL